MNKKGFTLVEVLVAVTILSIILLSLYSGISTNINALLNNNYKTKAMMIARTKLNEFILNKMRGTDISNKAVEEYPDYYYSRVTTRYENPLLGALLPANITKITVTWKEKQTEREKTYHVSYIYQVN